jgi:putative ABC transport system permease protein
MDTVLQDLRFALRTLLKNRGFATVAILTLALGIGATTAIFSVVNAVLIRPLGYTDPSRLFIVNQVGSEPGVGRIRMTPLDFLDFRERTRSFESMAAHSGTGFTFTGDASPELVIGQLVTAELFDVLGVRPMLGRSLRSDENEAGKDQVVVLSHDFWQRRFAGDSAAIGRTVTVNGRPYTIVGVMPRGFSYPAKTYALWAPLALRGTSVGGPPINRGAHYLQVIGRLRPGVTADAAGTEMVAIAKQLAGDHPESNENVGAMMTPLNDEVVGDVRGALRLLMGAVVFVLLIACANVTNLLLARATGRQREVAIRSALGATRGRIIRQLFTENALIYLAGAGVGLFIASWVLDIVMAYGPTDTPRLDTTTIDVPVLLFTIVATLAAALTFGLAPAWQLARDSVTEWLRAGQSAGGSRRAQWVRSVLTVGQIALCVVLLMGAGLALRSFARLQDTDRGFRTDNLLTFGVVLPASRLPEAAQMRTFAGTLVERFATDGSIDAVGTTTQLPLGGNDIENSFTVDAVPATAAEPVAGVRGIGGDYFRAMGITVRGRAFDRTDHATAPRVVIVNETFARRFIGEGNAVGRRVKMGGSDSDDPWRTIVGVSADVKHRSLAAEIRPEVYLPYVQLDDGYLKDWSRGVMVVIRSTIDPATLTAAAREHMKALDPNMPLYSVKTMEQLASDSVAEPRFRTLLLGAFGFLALALASVGIFGVMSYVVTQRTREIGIRMALGARPSAVLALILGHGGRLTLIGVTIGAVGAALVMRLMRSMLYEISPTDPLTFVAVIGLLGAAAMLAIYLPARRATRVDPLVALRSE